MPVQWARILLVDDDEVTRLALRRALPLRLKHVIVDTAPSGEAALQQIAAIRYDTVIADLRMPGMDGRAFLAEVNRRHPRTPGILVSGHANAVPPDRQNSFVFVPKPLQREMFFAVLRRSIALSARLRHASERFALLRAHANAVRHQYHRFMAARMRSGHRGPSAVVVTEPDGTIVHWNRGADALYGWSGQDVIGRNITTVSAAQNGVITERVRHGDPWEGAMTVRPPDGGERTVRLHASPLMDARRELIGILTLAVHAQTAS